SATKAASRISGPNPNSQRGSACGRFVAASAEGGASSSGMERLDQEDSAPSQLGELALVRVEHEGAGVLVGELEHGALALRQRYHVGPLVPLEVGARPVQPIEVAVQVEGVQQ